MEGYLKESPYYKATSADVDYLEKVRMQGEIQKWIDHSISVTVNMPEDVSEETVSQVYLKAHESGCKGVTVYREGSRSGVLISHSKEEKKANDDIIYKRSNDMIVKKVQKIAKNSEGTNFYIEEDDVISNIIVESIIIYIIRYVFGL